MDKFINSIKYDKIKTVKKIYQDHSYLINIHYNNNEAFRVACMHNRLETAKWLHQLGGSINVNLNDMFEVSCKKGYFKFAKWLRSLGININANNDSAFVLVCKYGHFEIAKWLHSLGVNINAMDDEAFRNSCRNNHFEIAKWLHTLGVDIYANNNGALKSACLNGNIEIARWLCSLGATIHINDDYVFKYANHYGFLEILKLMYNLDKKFLLSIGFNKNIYEKLEIDDNTICLLEIIANNKELPQLEGVVDDIIIYSLIHHKRIKDLEALPYVSYDIIDGKFVNVIIKRLKSKSARKV